MKRLGRHAAWLGWVVAGVLVFSQTQSTQGNQAGNAQGNDQHKGFPALRRGFLGGRFGGQLLHSETTVNTDNGVKTFVIARGQVTALSGSSIAINSDTRYGFRNFKQPQAQLKTGQTAMAIGTKSGNTITASNIATEGS